MFAVLALAGLLAAPLLAAEPLPLVRAHSHNDYRQARPLQDALDRGFCSVEADVHLRGHDLLVGHAGGDIKPGVTLQSLYLDPLLERVRQHGGRVYPGGPTLLLFVEFKSDGDASYPVLREILKKYEEMLTVFTPGAMEQKAVTIIITGRRPSGLLRAEAVRFAAIDGDLGDLGSDEKTLFPAISENWGSTFQWRGGSMSALELNRLGRYVREAHEHKRLLRFYGIPDREEAWALLFKSGVDLINTDHLDGLKAFLLR